MSATKTSYAATARFVGGWWAVDVPALKGVHTQGRDWRNALTMARDAIAGVLDIDPESVEVKLTPILPDHAEDSLKEVETARIERERAARNEQEILAKTAHTLVDSGLKVKDAAALLGLTDKRLYQVLGSKPTRPQRKLKLR